MQPFLRSFLAGLLTASSVGLGLFLTLVLLGAVGDGLFDRLLFLGGAQLAVLSVAVTAAATGLSVARQADRRGQGLVAGLLAGAVGQFVILVLFVVGLAVAGETPDPDGLLANEGEGLSATEFSQALVSLVPAGLTAGLVALGTTRRHDPFGAPQAPRHEEDETAPPDLADLADDAGEPEADAAPTPPRQRTLTCPRCHTRNTVAVGGGPITCEECGLPGRAP